MPQIGTSNCEQVFTSLVCIGNKLLSNREGFLKSATIVCVLFLLVDSTAGHYGTPKGKQTDTSTEAGEREGVKRCQKVACI